jgi:hypothetical protein
MMDESTSQGVNMLEASALDQITAMLNGQSNPGQQQPVVQQTQVQQPVAPVQQPPVQPETPPPALASTDALSAASFTGMFDDPVPGTEQTPVEVQLPTYEVAPPENLSDRGRNAWGELRHREKQAREYAERLKGELAKMKETQSQFATEREQFVASMKAKDDELTALKTRIGQADLTRTTEFRERYDAPLSQAQANLDAVIADEIIGADTPEGLARIREAVLASDDKFHHFISKLGTDAQIRLTDKRREYMNVAADRAHAIENWEVTSRGLTETAAQENAAERAMIRQRHADEAIKFNTSTVPLDHRPLVLTDDFYVDDVKTANQAFSDFMQTATEDKIARAAHLGYLMPVMSRALSQALAEARKYQEQYYVARGLMKPGMSMSSPAPRMAPIQPPKPAEPNRPSESAADVLDRHNEEYIARMLGQ